MTAWTHNVTCAVRVLGGAYSPKWAEYNWNAFNWGFSTDVQASIFHMISGDSLAPTTARIHQVAHVASGDALSLSEVNAKGFTKAPFGSSMPIASGLDTENLAIGIWDYVFPSNTANAHNRAVASYVSGSPGADAFTSLPVGSTSWTES